MPITRLEGQEERLLGSHHDGIVWLMAAFLGGGGCWRKGLCVAMPAQGGTFYDCVAGGISWIRLQLRETPCGRTEVSAQGHIGMNSLPRTTCSTPRTNRRALQPAQSMADSFDMPPTGTLASKPTSFILTKKIGGSGEKYVAVSAQQF